MLPVEIATKLRNFLSTTFTSVGLGATTGRAARTTKWLEDAVALLGASGNSSAAEIAEDTSNVSKMQLIDFICIYPLSHSQPEVCYPMTGARLLWWALRFTLRRLLAQSARHNWQGVIQVGDHGNPAYEAMTVDERRTVVARMCTSGDWCAPAAAFRLHTNKWSQWTSEPRL